MDVRKKRSEDGTGRLAELWSELAYLRDTAANIQRKLELLLSETGKASIKQQKPPLQDAAPLFNAEPLDYEGKLQRVQQERQRRMVGLWKTCSNLIKQLRGQKAAQLWFNVPVDTATHTRYLEIVKHPMDLSTVKQKLESGRYETPVDLASDIRLIWSNCEAFNPDPSAPVRQAARSVSQSFEKKWQGDQGIEMKWHEEVARRKAEDMELEELRKATSGTVVQKLQYFEQRVQDRLAELQPSKPAPGSLWSFEQKRKLSAAITTLQMDYLYGLMEVIAAHYPLDLGSSEEVMLDMDVLPDDVLHKMQLYLDEVEANAQKPRSNSRPNPTPNAASAPSQPAEEAAPAARPAPANDTVASVKPEADGDEAISEPRRSPAAAADEPSVTAKDGGGSSSTSGSSSSSDSGSSKSSKGGNSDDDDDAGSKEKVESTDKAGADKKWPGSTAEVGDASALVSATQPPNLQPQILKNKDAQKAVEVENANAWALLEENDIGENAETEATPMDFSEDPLWNDWAKISDEQEARAKAKQEEEEAAKKAKEDAEAEARRKEEEDASKKRKHDEVEADAEEMERLRREAKRKKDLEEMDTIGNNVEEDMGFGDFGEANGDTAMDTNIEANGDNASAPAVAT